MCLLIRPVCQSYRYTYISSLLQQLSGWLYSESFLGIAATCAYMIYGLFYSYKYRWQDQRRRLTRFFQGLIAYMQRDMRKPYQIGRYICNPNSRFHFPFLMICLSTSCTLAVYGNCMDRLKSCRSFYCHYCRQIFTFRRKKINCYI